MLLATGPIIPISHFYLQNKFSAFVYLIYYDDKDYETNHMYKSFLRNYKMEGFHQRQNAAVMT